MKASMYLCMVIFLQLVSCNEPVELNSSDLRILVEINRDIRESNDALLNKTEATISDKGNRTLDEELLNKISATLLMRQSHHLGFNLEDLEKNEVPSPIEETVLLNYLSVFGDAFEQLNYGRNNSEKTLELTQITQQYLEDKTLFNRLLLDLQIINLERDLIHTLASAVGSIETFGFEGKVHAYPQTLAPQSGERLKTVISLGHDFIGTNITLGNPEILINGDVSISYELESFHKGIWLLTFTPEVPGTHIIDFTTHFQSKVYPSEQYAFTGKFEVFVE